MPRITPSTHYKRYLFLRTAWLEFPKLYALLPLREQWQIHEFYQPSVKLTKDQLMVHIKNLSKTKPALVHQAGKHVRLMHKVFRYISIELGINRAQWPKALAGPIQCHKPTPVHMETKDGHRYTIAAVARSELDTRLLAKALLGAVQQRVKDEREDITHSGII